MPVISRFFGIAIIMHWRDHAPPHFHAQCQGQEVTIVIESGEVTGAMSNRELGIIEEWRKLHRRELAVNWQRAQRQMALIPIPPLE